MGTAPEVKTHRFFSVLESTFVGESIEGEGGYVNLLKVKGEYFRRRVKPQLERLIEERTEEFPEFREELLDKLYSFFHRYLNETGTPLVGLTPYHSSVYDRVYDSSDVKLYWKTSRHYYIKSDRILRSLEVEVDGFRVFFDVSGLEYKRSNEKRSLTYSFKNYSREERKLTLKVYYREGNRTTRVDDIRREVKRAVGVKRYTQEIPSEEVIARAIRTFEKQGKVDYFLCKDAKTFLREQFDLWMYQYIYSPTGHGDSAVWSERRIRQLQALRDIAYRVIDWISAFEDELLRIWLKPRFVFNSGYVVTLDRIADKRDGLKVVERILSHPGMDRQIEEWRELGIVDGSFRKEDVLLDTPDGRTLNPEYRFLPVDTGYFKDVETEILSLFENLDDELDGWLVKSENFQALNTILRKFRGKVQTIYIDPPFNKEQDADYDYMVEYRDSTWITMLENRIRLGKELLNERGSIFVRCDYNGNMYVRLLLNEIFGEENFRNELMVSRTKKIFAGVKGYNVANDSLFFYSKTENFSFFAQYKRRDKERRWLNMHSPGERNPPERVILGKLYYPPRGRHWTFVQEKIRELERQGRVRINEDVEYVDMLGNRVRGMPQYLTSEEELLDSNWTDIPGYSQTHSFQTENSEILLKRVIESTSREGDLVLDFFLGSGTTAAVAHKLGRRWIGVEMGEHFWTVVLRRMKRVLAYDRSGISRERDVRERYSRDRAGGFFKYFELEQYEDILRTVRYSDIKEDPESFPEECLFAADTKLLQSVEEESRRLIFNSRKLYPDRDIDLAETLSLLKGKRIRRVTEDWVEFEDSSRTHIKDRRVELSEIAPALWWR